MPVNNNTSNKIQSALTPSENSFVRKKWFKVAMLVSALVLFSAVAGFGGIGLFATHASLPTWLAHAVGTVGPGYNMAMFVGGLGLATASMVGLVFAARNKASPIIENDEVNEVEKEIENVEVNEVEEHKRQEKSQLSQQERAFHAMDNIKEFEKILDEDGFDVNRQFGISNSTLLHHAARHGKIECISLLIEKGADIESMDGCFETPLINAIILNNKEPVELLLEREANPNHINVDDLPLLWYALSTDRFEMLEPLLNYGADANFKNAEGQNLLHEVAENYFYHDEEIFHEEVKKSFQALFKRGLDVNAKDKNGNTPLHIASKKGKLPLVTFLVQILKADINSTDRNGKTPLEVSKTPEIGNILSDKAKNPVNELLYNSINSNDLETFNSLIDQNGIDINYSVSGSTLLHAAIEKGSEKMITSLLNKGADINAKNSKGETPLHLATYVRKSKEVNKKMVEILLKAEADIYSTDNKGRTPLEVSKIPEIQKILDDKAKELR